MFVAASMVFTRASKNRSDMKPAAFWATGVLSWNGHSQANRMG